MKKFKYILFLIISFLCFKNVKASNCAYEDFAKYNRAALDIKTSYEFKETKDETGYITEYFQISAINVPETLYIIVSGDNGTRNTLNPDSSGIVSFPSYSLGSVVNFKFEVYTSSKTACPNEKVTELYLKKPMLNPYYSTGYCLADPDNSFCDRFVFHEVSMEDYDKFAKTTRDNKKSENEKLLKEEEKDDSLNKIYIIAGISFGILIIGYIGYRVIKSRGQRL